MGQDEGTIVLCVDDQSCRNISTTLQIDNLNSSIQIYNDPIGKSNSRMSNQEEKPICRICHCSNEDLESSHLGKKKWTANNCDKFNINNPFFLITPCYCTGTLQYVHHKCLQQWIRFSNHKYCELCKYSFKLKTKNKPLYQWEFFNMSGGERRKLIFHILFNLVSMICVFWSIYVIAERASHELSGRLGWRFWVKMFVVTVGFVCGIIFIIFQIKLYLSILVRWKQYNQIIIIENVCKENLFKTNGNQHHLQMSPMVHANNSELQNK